MGRKNMRGEGVIGSAAEPLHTIVQQGLLSRLVSQNGGWTLLNSDDLQRL